MGLTYGYKDGDLPVTEDISGRLLRLPVFYEISELEQSRVVEEVRNYLEAAKVRIKQPALATAQDIGAAWEGLGPAGGGSGDVAKLSR